MKQLLVFSVLFSYLIFPQTGSLKGKVTDVETGKPLLGVSLIIQNTNLGAATINGGEYFITKISEGKFDITVSYPGYKTITIKDVDISANGSNELNVSLPRSNDFDMPSSMESFYLDQLPENLNKKLKELKRFNKTEYYRSLQEIYFDFIIQTDKTDKMELELLEIEVDSKLIAVKYKKASLSEQLNFQKELTDKLRYQFDLKQKLRLKDLSELAKKIDFLEEFINKSKANKEDIINNKVKQLLKN
jgi:hypothetical protein